MFKKCLAFLFVCSFLCAEETPVVIKKKKRSTKKVKEQVLEELDTILENSTKLIRGLTHVSDKSIRCVKKIVSGEGNSSKSEYEACQKRLAEYNQKIEEMIQEVESVFTSF